MICIIDNYDSFVYNLYQYVGEIQPNIVVYRNDKVSIAEIEKLKPSHIILSPGPGRPEDAGICVELINYFGGKIPILGICLGLQAIGLAFGGKIGYAKQVMHGKQSLVTNNGKGIFKDIPDCFMAVRYHSLIVERQDLPDSLQISAYTEDNTIMAFNHKQYPIYGLQFHPESILTEYGKVMIRNFLNVK